MSQDWLNVIIPALPFFALVAAALFKYFAAWIDTHTPASKRTELANAVVTAVQATEMQFSGLLGPEQKKLRAVEFAKSELIALHSPVIPSDADIGIAIEAAVYLLNTAQGKLPGASLAKPTMQVPSVDRP